MAGFDAMYRKEDPDAGLAEIAAREQRVLLTRDRHLLMRGDVTRGYWVRSAEPKHQLVEVLRRFDLASSMKPFTRCMECNTVLEAASRESRLERLPPGAAEKNNFNRCPTCGRIYWEGSHHMRMKELLESIQAEISRS